MLMYNHVLFMSFFLSFTHAESLTAASLSSYNMSAIQENGLDTKWLISQGYDGASVMSGKNTGGTEAYQRDSSSSHLCACSLSQSCVSRLCKKPSSCCKRCMFYLHI